MITFPPTLILRHKRENKKKCSLRGLEKATDIYFYEYPWTVEQPDLSSYVVLTLDGPLLSKSDAQKGLFLIDSTWRYSEKMLKSLKGSFEVRSLPKELKTAYPRRQEDCKDPSRGLASIEALYAAYKILGRKYSHLLDFYHWKIEFLSSNNL